MAEHIFDEVLARTRDPKTGLQRTYTICGMPITEDVLPRPHTVAWHRVTTVGMVTCGDCRSRYGLKQRNEDIESEKPYKTVIKRFKTISLDMLA